MTKRIFNNIRLGMFVIAGLMFLVLLLYMIGKNQHMFGSNYHLKTRFQNVQGLKAGHNVRYSGIEVGTVNSVTFLNDTLIEVDMLIEKRMKNIIRGNAIVSIGTEGFVGNKVVNIFPGRESVDFAKDGDLLNSKKPVDTDEMLRTLSKTNNDVATVAENLKATIQNINTSQALWQLLNDKTLPANIRISAGNIRQATDRAATMINDLQSMVTDVRNGKGSLGTILTDSSFALNLNQAVLKINAVAEHADSLAEEINKFVSTVKHEVNSGKGVVNALLKDSAMTTKINQSLDHIEKGTSAFNQDMEALKHNFLFRGYFRKLEKQKQKEEKTSAATNQ